MKKALIGVTLALLLISFVKGSQGLEAEHSAVKALNAAVDSTLQNRLHSLCTKPRPAADSESLTASLLY